MQPPQPTHVPQTPNPRGPHRGTSNFDWAHPDGLQGGGEPPPAGQVHGAPVAPSARRGRALRPGPKLSNRAWLFASGVLFVTGATVFIAAGALALSDKWRIDPVLSVKDDAPRAAALVGHGKAGQGAASAISSTATSTGATVLLSADAPIVGHHLFWLQAPRRLVVDLMGVHEALGAPVVAPSHPLVRKVRWAHHDDRVRFVIEVAPEAHEEVQAHVDGASLALTLHKRDPAL